MSFHNIFKRKSKYTSLSEGTDHHHEDDVGLKGKDMESTQSSDGTLDEEITESSEIPEEDPTDPSLLSGEQKLKKKKSFFKIIRNIILLKNLRSKRRKRKHSVYDELDEDYGELDGADFEVVVVQSGNNEEEEQEEYESLERVVGNGKKYKIDKTTKDRITSKRRARNMKRRKLNPSGVQKRKSTKKKVMKATKSTGKFIGRGVIYTGSAFQYLAPVTSPPPERTWKKWHERPLRPYRQSEFVFV